MEAMITTSNEYKTLLSWHFDELDSVNGTSEELNASLHFKGNVVIDLVDNDYRDLVWKVMESYSPTSSPATAIDSTNLDFYFKMKKGWFDSKTAKEYGKEIFSQLDNVLNELKLDKYTRRAVIRMPSNSCLISLQFMYRQLQTDEIIVPVLITTAYFRSSDAIKGLPVDMFIIQQIAHKVEQHMLSQGFPVFESTISINAGSLHIYDSDRHLF